MSIMDADASAAREEQILVLSRILESLEAAGAHLPDFGAENGRGPVADLIRAGNDELRFAATSLRATVADALDAARTARLDHG